MSVAESQTLIEPLKPELPAKQPLVPEPSTHQPLLPEHPAHQPEDMEVEHGQLAEPGDKQLVPDMPPIIRLPGCPLPYTNIEIKPLPTEGIEVVTETSRCIQLVATLQKEKVVAVATEGINIGREGSVTVLQIGTCSGMVYIFDVLINRDLLIKGRLKSILESEDTLKVVHNCSKMCAALNFQFAITMRNVFDTQVAHQIMQEHAGRRLPAGLPLSEISLRYTDDVHKYASFDWRNDQKAIWTEMVGNFWATRPLTVDMIEFAACDVIVIVPDVYYQQNEYLEANGLMASCHERVAEEVALEIDAVVKEERGKRVSAIVDTILHEIDATYDDRIQLLGVMDEDHMNALALATYDDTVDISQKVCKLKTEQILHELTELDVQLRMGISSWQTRDNLLEYLRYYTHLPDEKIQEKAKDVFQQTIEAILEHVTRKYDAETSPRLLSECEKQALLTISHDSVDSVTYDPVICSIYWNVLKDELLEMINMLRLCPKQFILTADDYTRLEIFATEATFIPEDVSSLASALLATIRTYHATSGNSVIREKRKCVTF